MTSRRGFGGRRGEFGRGAGRGASAGGIGAAMERPRAACPSNGASSWAVTRCPRPSSDIVGSKSRNLQDLRGRLPDWINLPASVALPFCTFDAVLAHPDNDFVLQQLEQLRFELHNLDFGDTAAFESLLGRMRATTRTWCPRKSSCAR